MGNRLIKLTFSVIFIGLVLSVIDFQNLINQMANISVSLIAFLILGELAFYSIESIRIYRLSKKLYSFKSILRSRLLSVFAGNLLPGMVSSELLRLFILDREKPGNKLSLGSILIMNRVYGLLSMFVILGSCLLFFDMGTILDANVSTIAVVGLSICLILGSTFPILSSFDFVRRVGLSILQTLKRFGKLYKILRPLYMVGRHTCSPHVWLFQLTTSTLTNLIAISQYYIIASVVGGPENFLFWAIALPLVSIGSVIPIGVGLIGPQDASLLAIAAFMGYSKESFLAISLVVHGMRILGSLPGAFFLNELWGTFRSFYRGDKGLKLEGSKS